MIDDQSALLDWKAYWAAFEYFQTGIDDCPKLAEIRGKWPSFLAKRLLNDYKAVLNKLKIPSHFGIIDPECFAFMTFLYYGNVYSKKEYLQCLENVVCYELEILQYDKTDENN